MFIHSTYIKLLKTQLTDYFKSTQFVLGIFWIFSSCRCCCWWWWLCWCYNYFIYLFISW